MYIVLSSPTPVHFILVHIATPARMNGERQCADDEHEISGREEAKKKNAALLYYSAVLSHRISYTFILLYIHTYFMHIKECHQPEIFLFSAVAKMT